MTASMWTHSICERCWQELHPDREPVRVSSTLTTHEKCCICGKMDHSGIYFREDPKNLPCEGKHGE